MNSMSKKIAIIGAGISGIAASYFLEESDRYEITLFEKDENIGGHAVTVDIPLLNKTIPVDPIVYLFSFPRYPFFSAWLKSLNIELNRTQFSQYTYNEDKNTGIFYSATLSPSLLKSVFCEGHLIKNFKNLKIMKNISNRINDLEKKGLLDSNMSFDDFFESIPEATKEFRENFLYPAIQFFYLCDIKSIGQHPMYNYFRSTKSMTGNSFYYIKKGVANYLNEVRKQLSKTNILTNTGINALHYDEKSEKWIVKTDKGSLHHFDIIISAAQPNQIVEILEGSIPQAESNFSQDTFDSDKRQLINILNSIEYYYFHATIHNDSSFMPHKRTYWSTYNFKYASTKSKISGTLWSGQMYKKSIFTTFHWDSSREDLFDTVNQNQFNGTVYYTSVHTRIAPRFPLYEARKKIEKWQGRKNLWFTGSWLTELANHEDGLVSTLNMIKALYPNYRDLPRFSKLLSDADKSVV
jgi:predicted NAD/FAD-binding protein